MDSIALIRTLISDAIQYGVADSEGDGVTVEFVTPNAPIYTGSTRVFVDVNPTSNFTVDEELGLVTMATAPGNGVKVTVSSKFTMLTNVQIQALLDQYSGSDTASAVKLAAADALDIIASSEAMIQKRIKLLDLTTDGPAVADSLRKHAKTLREGIQSEPSFDFAEQVNDNAGFVEKMFKDFMRSGM